MVCQGKAWVSSLSPIPGVYDNSHEASTRVFRNQISVKVRNIMISMWTHYIRIHIPQSTGLSGSQLFVVSLSGCLAGYIRGHKYKCSSPVLLLQYSLILGRHKKNNSKFILIASEVEICCKQNVDWLQLSFGRGQDMAADMTKKKEAHSYALVSFFFLFRV